MTRSVEIPEAAARVAEFVRQRERMGGQADLVYTVHADPDTEPAPLLLDDLRALAALPYLAPAEECICVKDEVGRWITDRTGLLEADPDCPVHFPAPAGDGGLREALEEAARLINTYLNSTSLQDSGLTIAEALRDEGLLAAHPAAPAVPQPADPVADWTRLDECAAASAQMIQWHAPETAAVLIESAVPQPVDREALRERIENVLRGFGMQVIVERGIEDYAVSGATDAVLAVLAGEQEQARG